MSIEPIISNALSFAQQHFFVTVGLIGVAGIVAYKKPKVVLQIAIVVLLFGGIFFATSYLGEPLSTGVQQKDKMAYKTEKVMN
jgi:hypothetical protein